MTEAIMVFIAGISGVFFGMAFLYLSIKCTQVVLDFWERKKEASGMVSGQKEAQ